MVVFFINSFNKHLLNDKYITACTPKEFLGCYWSHRTKWRCTACITRWFGEPKERGITEEQEVREQQSRPWSLSVPCSPSHMPHGNGHHHHPPSYSSCQPEAHCDLTLFLTLMPESSQSFHSISHSTKHFFKQISSFLSSWRTLGFQMPCLNSFVAS